MIDFIGVIDFGRIPAAPRETDFRYLSESGAVDLNFGKLELDFARFLWLNADAGDLHQDEELVVLVYGKCYTRLFDPFWSAPRKLFAADLATLFRTRGESFVDHIKGSFVIVILDREQRRVMTFTDPLNLRGVYYTAGPDNLVLSSSLGALVSYLEQHKQPVSIDRRAVLDHYLFDFVLDDHTFIRDVRLLSPGSSLTFSGSGPSVRTYFDPFSAFSLSGPTLDQRAGAEQLKDVLTRNILLFSEGPEKTAVALTGGFDSRSILALLGGAAREYQFFSYGRRGSWDLKIPQLIADRLGLSYTPIYLEDQFREEFSRSAGLSVLLSDGRAEFNHANIAFVYARSLQPSSSILTGLLGSELIKTPSNRGLFIDDHVIAMLNAASPVEALEDILGAQPLPVEAEPSLRDELREMVSSHPFLNNDLPLNEKYFHYLLMVGLRKYFSKEITIQRTWKDNLHPFFDLDFIQVLLQTPFPWVYNFSQEKSLLKNLTIHKLYAMLIHTNPVLSNIMSTHGYRPRHLLNGLGLPVLAMEYLTKKKKIRRSSGLEFQQLSLGWIDGAPRELLGEETPFTRSIQALRTSDPDNYVKLTSLQYWFRSFGLGL